MTNQGFIKIHRSIIDWEWYNDLPVFKLFTHLLLVANFEDKRWRGIFVKRGELITSLENLANSTRLTIKQIRIALDKLKKTNEIAIKTTNKFSLIKVVNYNIYQDVPEEKGKQNDTQEDKQTANEGQTKDKQRATTKECKELKKDKNILSSSLQSEDNEDNLKSFPSIFEDEKIDEEENYQKTIDDEITLDLDLSENPLLEQKIDADATNLQKIIEISSENEINPISEEIILEGNIQEKEKTNLPQKEKKEKFDQFHLGIATTLAENIKSKKKISISSKQIKNWAREIYLLEKINLKSRNSAFDDIGKAMLAIEEYGGSQYFPVIESGKSFREKFTKIENFLERNKQQKTNADEWKEGVEKMEMFIFNQNVSKL